MRIVVLAALFLGLYSAPAMAAPTVTIESGPDGPTNDSTPTFGFTVENAVEVECSVDQGTEDFGPCTTDSSHTPDPLAEGDWTFRVRATDDVPETTSDTRAFTVDLTAPTVALGAGGPSGPTNDPQPSFSWTAAGDDESLRQCSLDSGTASFGACTTSTRYDQATPLSEGSYTFRIRVEDEAGNTAVDTRAFAVDLTAPTVNLTSLGPTGPTNDSRPSFSWTTATENGRQCSVDQGVPNFGPCTSPNRHDQPTDLADGAYTFRVRVTDPAGNTASASRAFSVDTVGPAAEVSGPRRTGDRTPSFRVSSPAAGASFTCKLDGRRTVGCGPRFVPASRLKFGRHTLLVTAHDNLGNPGAPRAFRFTVLRPPLEAGRAGNAVEAALRRHGFARRVIRNLERSCSRLGRYAFTCRFTSAFRGYRLKGHGPVKLRRGRISYRFAVRAQGRKFVLTDENEPTSRG